MSVAGGFRSKCEIEAMARLRFISVHHADGVNELEEKKRTKKRVNENAKGYIIKENCLSFSSHNKSFGHDSNLHTDSLLTPPC